MKLKVLEKQERALGTKLFIKPIRSYSAKSAIVKRPYKPGPRRTPRRGGKQGSEYKRQLSEKQKVRFSYGITEKDMRRYFVFADHSKEPTDIAFLRLLESRLDNVVFRLGFAPSRSVARQLIGHGHFTLNGRKVTIPSIRLRAGDTVAVRPGSAEIPPILAIAERLKTAVAPVWLSVNPDLPSGTLLATPRDTELFFDLNLVVNFYSK